MKRITLALTICALSLSTVAQEADRGNLEDQVLFTVEDDTVTAGEYIAVYNKNRNLGKDIDPKTPMEYLDLYVNFKLKVHQAKEMGKDTSEAFQREYFNYRNQLSQPYLTDNKVTEELIREAYSRMKYDVRAAHIMLVPEGDDTLSAYNKAKELIQRINKGEDFEALAREHSKDDYSAKNGGDLGYFTVFSMIYPFESAAYNTPVGKIAPDPVKTRFGYHIVKAIDKRPARGMISVAHIMLISNEKSTSEEAENTEKKINEIYNELENGAKFEDLVLKYSDDKTTSKNGGLLRPFGINRMHPDFEEAAFSLQNPDDYSKPVKTPVGWHIIKLVSKETLLPFEESKTTIKKNVERDDRSQQSITSLIKTLKKEYSFKEYPKVKKQAFKQVNKQELKLNNYKAENLKGGDKVLFEFVDNKFTVKDYLSFLAGSQSRLVKEGSLERQLNSVLDGYQEQKIIEYEKTRLEDKYPDFRLLSREYYEGILLFDLTEEKVWRKAVEDSTGLYEYYNANKDKYRWDKRYDLTLVDAADKKLAKKAMKALKKGNHPDTVQNQLNVDSQLNVNITQKVFEEGDSKMPTDFDIEETGFTKIKEIDNRYRFIAVNKIMPPTTKTLDEARGLVISNYQDHLEKEWIKSLKEKYKVNINNKVLEKTVATLETEAAFEE